LIRLGDMEIVLLYALLHIRLNSSRHNARPFLVKRVKRLKDHARVNLRFDEIVDTSKMALLLCSDDLERYLRLFAREAIY